MQFEVQTAIPERWDPFVEAHPSGSIYHSSSWLRLVCETYRYRLLFVLARAGSTIEAGIPLAMVDSWLTGRKLVAFPFSDSCEPLLAQGGDFTKLLQFLCEERCKSRAGLLEIRGIQPGEENRPEGAYTNHRLSLDKSTKGLWRGLHHDCIQRRIEKAKRLGVVCENGSLGDAGDAREFYRLHAGTRKHQGVPVQPILFFKSLFRAMPSPGRIELSFARFAERRVATILVLYFGGVAYFKFGASEERFNWTGAGQFLMWTAIRSAQLRGAQTFDFGRTSATNRGLRDYKRRWGTTERPLYYLEEPTGGRLRPLVETSRPHALIKTALRHLPWWVNRLTGKYLYRHFA